MVTIQFVNLNNLFLIKTVSNKSTLIKLKMKN
jgi:hypothetical protein